MALEHEVGLDAYYTCICSFLRGLYQCSLFSKENQMINYRINRLIELLAEFIGGLSDLERSAKDKKVAAIRRLSTIQKDTSQQNALSEQDKHKLDKVVPSDQGTRCSRRLSSGRTIKSAF